jgi:site-specific DNA-adenine methylase
MTANAYKKFLQNLSTDIQNLSVLKGYSLTRKNTLQIPVLRGLFPLTMKASESNFSLNGISKLYDYSVLIGNWKITNLSYEQLLTDNKECFTYLDPPYEIGSNLYGKRGSMHKSFDHDAFAADCDRFVGPQLVSYNSSQIIRDRFLDWKIAEFAHTYTMRSVGTYNTDQAQRKELVLLNYEV